MPWLSSKHDRLCCHLPVVLDNCRRNATAAFPLPSDTAIQPLDSSARKSLICMILNCTLCGLRAGFRERRRGDGRPSESGMWSAMGQKLTAQSAGFRRNPNNTQGSARSGKKKPQPRWLGSAVWWSWGESNPRPQIFLVRFYMLSDLLWISPPTPRSRTLSRQPVPLNLARTQGTRVRTSRCECPRSRDGLSRPCPAHRPAVARLTGV